MKGMRQESLASTLLPVGFAIALWYFSFAMDYGNFWVKISFSATCIATYALAVDFSYFKENLRFSWSDILWGALSAATLYGIFFLGNFISKLLFPFAVGEVSSIYGRGAGVSGWMIAPALILITGPAEEIFWRGFLQRRLSVKFGGFRGWMIATAFYASVHISSMNFMLTGAAAVAGAFWGLMYLFSPRLGAVIISHAIWSSVIFAVFPIR